MGVKCIHIQRQGYSRDTRAFVKGPSWECGVKRGLGFICPRFVPLSRSDRDPL
jgi:hypothetical protein